jgi:hypothetical protein
VQNSDVYLRSLIILAQVDTNSEEATAELHREYAQMERYPYDPLFSLSRHSRDIIPISPTALSRIAYSGRIILQAILGSLPAHAPPHTHHRTRTHDTTAHTRSEGGL